MQRSYNFILIIYYQVFTLIAFYSLIFAFKRLVRKGVSIKARWAFFMKHTSYVVVILIVWTVQLFHNYNELFSRNKNTGLSEEMKSIEILSYSFIFSNGFLLSMVRMIDPYYRYVLKRSF